MTEPASEESIPFEIVGTSGDDEWLERRLSGVGASEAAMMMGQHPKHGEGGPAVLWAWKTGRQEPENLDGFENVEWGHIMEPLIVEQFGSTRYAGRRVEKTAVQLRSVEFPWALCTLDAWTWHPKHGRIPLEAKNVGAYQSDRWVGSVPDEMWWQLQWQIFVTAAPCASIAACVGGNALWWEDVERDESAQQAIEKRGGDFWTCVEEDRVPLHVPSLASVRALYPAGAESGTVQLSGDTWLDDDVELQSIKEDQKELKQSREVIEARIADAIGEHEMGVLSSGTAYTNKTQTRGAYEVAEKSFKVLRRKKGPN